MKNILSQNPLKFLFLFILACLYNVHAKLFEVLWENEVWKFGKENKVKRLKLTNMLKLNSYQMFLFKWIDELFDPQNLPVQHFS